RSRASLLRNKALIEHDPKKPAPDLIRGGHRFSEKIMLERQRPARLLPVTLDPPLGMKGTTASSHRCPTAAAADLPSGDRARRGPVPPSRPDREGRSRTLAARSERRLHRPTTV